jgi:hypothetical protein
MKTFARSARSRHLKKYHGEQSPPEDAIVPVQHWETSQLKSARVKTGSRKHKKLRPQHVKDQGARQSHPFPPVEDYRKEVQTRIEAAIKQLEGMQELLRRPGTERLRNELPIYTGLMRVTITPDVVECDPDTPAIIGLDKFDHEATAYQLLICSDSEADSIFTEAGIPGVPLLIPITRNSRPPPVQGMNPFLEYIATKGHVGMHIFSSDQRKKKAKAKKAKAKDTSRETSEFISAEPFTGQEAVDIFRSPDPMPCNFLDLQIHKPNPQPWFVAQHRDLQIMRDIPEHNIAGKQSETVLSDLSNCDAFHICAKAGAFTMPHMDHHHVTTIITCEEGEKLWLIWPQQTDEELRTWAKDGQYCPSFRPFAVFLRPGDILVLPPGRVHAPFSPTDVLMTGTMHWHSRHLVGVPIQSLLEVEHPTVTNEEPAKEFIGKMKNIAKFWRDRKGPWEFGTDDQLQQFTSGMKVNHPTSSSP